MRFVERFIRRQEQEGKPPQVDPLARRIDVERHRLKFYEGFSEFADAWNQYLDSDARQAMREWVGQLEGVELDADVPVDVEAEYMETIRDATERLASEDLSKEEAKKLRRMRRRASEKIAKLGTAEPETPDTFETRIDRLKDADRSFVTSLETKGACEFYALEFFLGDYEEIDKIFIEKVVREDKSQFEGELALWGMNFSYWHKVANYFTPASEPLEQSELRARVDSDTKRQVIAAFGTSRLHKD